MKRRKIIPCNSKLKEYARKLRNETAHLRKFFFGIIIKERIWRNYDFDRQKPIDNCIVDFYCKDLMLAIEIDGESHYGVEEKDEAIDKN